MTDNRKLFAVGLIVALFVAVVVAQFASSSPDGLEYVAEQEGFAETAADHDLATTPLADYGEGLTGNDGWNTAIAGLFGTLVTLAVGYGVFWFARRTGTDDPDSHAAGEPS